jgi:hypothetical protein
MRLLVAYALLCHYNWCYLWQSVIMPPSWGYLWQYALICHYNWCYLWPWALLCHAAHLARQFVDKGKPLEKYIRWRTQLCNTLCFWTFVFRLCIWSHLPIHSVRLNAAQLGLDCILRLSHLQLSLGYPIFGYPSLSSRSVFGSCLSCLHLVSESSCCINHPGLINTLPRLTCSW